MKDKIFLDSNIFLYGFSDIDPQKHEVALGYSFICSFVIVLPRLKILI